MQNSKKEHIIFFLNKLQIILRLSQNECFELQEVERWFNLTKQYVHVSAYVCRRRKGLLTEGKKCSYNCFVGFIVAVEGREKQNNDGANK